MDNHKLITIFFLKHNKNVILLILENIYEKLSRFSCMHKNKTFFFNKEFFIVLVF